MRTTLSIPPEKIEELVRVTGAGTKRKAVETAIDAFLVRARMKKMKSLKGKVGIDDSWRKARELDLAGR
jgi:hypothetical protein